MNELTEEVDAVALRPVTPVFAFAATTIEPTLPLPCRPVAGMLAAPTTVTSSVELLAACSG